MLGLCAHSLPAARECSLPRLRRSALVRSGASHYAFACVAAGCLVAECGCAVYVTPHIRMRGLGELCGAWLQSATASASRPGPHASARGDGSSWTARARWLHTAPPLLERSRRLRRPRTPQKLLRAGVGAQGCTRWFPAPLHRRRHRFGHKAICACAEQALNRVAALELEAPAEWVLCT